MKTFFRQVGCVLPFLCIGLLLLALIQPTNISAAGATLSFQTSFDNGLVDVIEPDQRHLELLVTAPETMRAVSHKRLPLNIALVIDKSGSMGRDNKMSAVKQAAESMLDRLRPRDRFSLITFNSRAEVIIPSEFVEELHVARSLIRSIRAGGGTDIYDGLQAGYEQVQRYSSPRTINRVMLLSDGISRGEGRCKDIALRKADNGISLSSFGVGVNFNENLMAALAENGRGMYYFIDHPGQISTILAKEFQLTEQVVATGIRIEIELHSGVVLNKVYANSYDLQGNRLIINGGDLSVGERRRYQVRLSPPAFTAGSHNIGKVRFTYTPAGMDQTVIARKKLDLLYQPNISKIDTYKDQGVIERSSVFLVQYAKDDAAKAVDQGNVEQAQQILSQAQTHLQGRTEQSAKLRNEEQELSKYSAALSTNMDGHERARIQKAVKYRKHVVEGC